MEQGTMRLGFTGGDAEGPRASRSKWATLKLKRSWWLFNELINRVDIWNSTNGLDVPVRVSSDRTMVEFLTPAGLLVPVDEWALLLGDAVHNSRSALDAAIWDLAHFGGAVPRVPHRVGFPITSSEEAWLNAVRSLESVPDEFLDRIRSAQPWTDQPQNEDAVHWLQVLTRLDNDHKHRGAVTALPTGDSIRVEGLNARLGEHTASGGFFHLLADVVGDPPSPGEPFAQFSFGAFIDSASTDGAYGHMDLHAAVSYEGHTIPMTSLQTTLIPYLEALLGMIETGMWPQETWINPVRAASNQPDDSAAQG